MKVRLMRNSRILHKAGEVVEVSPAEAGFLISTGSAVAVPGADKKPDVPAQPKRPKKDPK